MDSIKEEKPHDLDEMYMDYEDYENQPYEQLTIETLPEIKPQPSVPTPKAKSSTVVSKRTTAAKTKKQTSTKSSLAAATVVAAEKPPAQKTTITKPLIQLKPSLSHQQQPSTSSAAMSIDNKSSIHLVPEENIRDLALQPYFDESMLDPNTGEQLSAPGSDTTAKNEEKPAAKKRNAHKLPKQCNVCGLIVTRLRDHMKSHPDQLEFKCSHCPRTYLTKNGLDRHVDVQHADDR